MDWDVFISHAWEDKETFARPLAKALIARGLNVWFDEFTLTVGDSLRRKIDEGLAHSKYGIVILSPSFFAKEWPQKELDALVTRESGGTKVILPVWHRITAEQIGKYSPLLADRVAVSSDRGLDDVVPQLLHAMQFTDEALRLKRERDAKLAAKKKAEEERLAKERAERDRIAREQKEREKAERDRVARQEIETTKSLKQDEGSGNSTTRYAFIALGVVVLLGALGFGLSAILPPTQTSTPTRVALATRTDTTIAKTKTIIPDTSTPDVKPTPTTPRMPTNTAIPTIPIMSSPAITSLTPSSTPNSVGQLPKIEEKVIGDAPMVFVPVGDFIMGTQRDAEASQDEKPAHNVYLDGYWIDKYEVTNAMYQKCVDAGACKFSGSNKSGLRGSTPYYGNPEFDNYPVINMSWYHADTYCRWVGKRLPTEAEWEKAARWTDARIYPWGNSFDQNRLNSRDGRFIDTTAGGSYPLGASPYGVMDMAGNVWEWVADWYATNFYENSPIQNPTGPSTGTMKIRRGGSWMDELKFTRLTTLRSPMEPHNNGQMATGFRCAE